MSNPSVIYEDADVLVINKPSGLIVHSDGRTAEPSVVDWLMTNYPKLKDVGEPWTSPQGEVIPRPGIVHRLDRTTSGVLIIAKTQEVYVYLKGQFKERAVQKKYLAYVYGHPKKDSEVIVAEIGRTRSDPPRWSAEFKKKGTLRDAITEWKMIKRGVDHGTQEKVSLLEVSPKTGRTHQIRVHLKAIGNPIVSDALYAPNKPKLLGFMRPALHAYSVSVILPSGVQKTFETPLPPDFENAQKLFD